MKNIDWEYHLKLFFYECEDNPTVEKLYQTFKKRLIKELDLDDETNKI